MGQGSGFAASCFVLPVLGKVCCEGIHSLWYNASGWKLEFTSHPTFLRRASVTPFSTQINSPDSFSGFLGINVSFVNALAYVPIVVQTQRRGIRRVGNAQGLLVYEHILTGKTYHVNFAL